MPPSIVRRTSIPWTAIAAIALTACVSPPEPFDDEALGVAPQSAVAIGPPGTWQRIVIPRGIGWQYADGGVDLGDAWRIYEPGAWPEARAPLGYGEPYLATAISSGPDPAHKPPTVYFRRTFFGAPNVRALFLRVMYDDGFAFYINGRDGGRVGLPEGPLSFATLAEGHEASQRYVTFDISSQISSLVPYADNTLAFEVHQVRPDSSDLVFDAELIAWIEGSPGVAQEELPRGSYWRVWDRGTDPGADWRAPGFDDAAWPSGPGPLGFGEDYLTTDVTPGPITTYFRTTLDRQGTVSRILGDVLYDDGFVVYLNGTEIGRGAMPAGPVTPSTFAQAHEANATYETFDWSAAVPLLVRGPNTLAVEVHQSHAASSDLVFDLALRIAGGWQAQRRDIAELLRGVWFLDASRGFAIGSAGALWTTDDGGATWTARASGTGADLRAIQFIDAQHGWIAGTQGTILATADGGATWTAQATGSTANLAAVSFTSPTDGWTVGDREGATALLRTLDGGRTWSRVTSAPVGTWSDVAFVDRQSGWLVGSALFEGDTRGTIYHTTDGGGTWTRQWLAPHHFHHLHDLEVLSPTTAWVAGQRASSGVGEIKLVTHDGGATWSDAAPSGSEVGLLAVDFVDDRFGWAVGVSGSIIHTEDGGATWTIQEAAQSFVKPWLFGVHFVDRQRGWAVGRILGTDIDASQILHTSTGGT